MTCISYVNNATDYTRHIPIHLQRLQILEYCGQAGLEVRFQQVEILGMDHLPTLLDLVERKRPAEIVLFSVYALPPDDGLRSTILDAALSNGVALHFANEGQLVDDDRGRRALERVLGFATAS